jgi:hypothetical protein
VHQSLPSTDDLNGAGKDIEQSERSYRILLIHMFSFNFMSCLCVQGKVLAGAMQTLVDILKTMLGMDADSLTAHTFPPLARSDIEALEVRLMYPPCLLTVRIASAPSAARACHISQRLFFHPLCPLPISLNGSGLTSC